MLRYSQVELAAALSVIEGVRDPFPPCRLVTALLLVVAVTRCVAQSLLGD